MLSSVGTADNNPPIQVDSFEAKWAEQNALKKLKKDIGLFGRTMFPTALNKDIPPFHNEIYKSLADESLENPMSPNITPSQDSF